MKNTKKQNKWDDLKNIIQRKKEKKPKENGIKPIIGKTKKKSINNQKNDIGEIKTKICNICKIEKLIYEFNKTKACKYGVRGTCKKCQYSYRPKEKIQEGYKKCTKCNEIKPLSEFWKLSRNKTYGLNYRCKKCLSIAKPKEVLLEDHKRCTKCKEIKLLNEFERDRNQCKECRKQYKKDSPDKIKKSLKVRYEKNNDEEFREKKRIKRREHYQNNIEKEREKGRKYYQNNIEKERERSRQKYISNKEKHKKYTKQWSKNNPEYQKNYVKNRRKNDIKFSLMLSMRDMITRTFNLIGTKKERRTIDYLGYSPEKLKLRLEVNFTDGMSWDNYGEWHKDHIIPINRFLKRGVTDPKIINALCNLKPRWKTTRNINGIVYVGNLNKGVK